MNATTTEMIRLRSKALRIPSVPRNLPALIRDLGGLLRKPASTLHILHVAREPRGSRECSEDPPSNRCAA